MLDDETGLHYWDPLFDAWHRDYGRRLRLWARPEGRDRHAVMFDMARLDVQKRFVAYVDQAYTAIADKDFPTTATRACAGTCSTRAANPPAPA